MLGKVGLPELAIILGIVILIFGPSRLPKFGRALGDTIKEFRNVKKMVNEGKAEVNDLRDTLDRELKS